MKYAIIACVAAAATLLAGCASTPPVRYYSLGNPIQASTAAPAMPLLIELPPVAMPERLVRPHLVVRTSGGQIDVLELHRWAAPFDAELHDALAAGIAQQLGAVDVSGGGRLAGQPVYRIKVQLRQWDAQPDSAISAAFSWTIRRSDDTRNLACQWSQSEPVGPGMDALAQGAQRLTARAAQSMAAAVKALAADANALCPV